jgi:hypothetical protein
MQFSLFLKVSRFPLQNKLHNTIYCCLFGLDQKIRDCPCWLAIPFGSSIQSQANQCNVSEGMYPASVDVSYTSSSLCHIPVEV